MSPSAAGSSVASDESLCSSSRVRPLCHCLKVYEDEVRNAIADGELSNVKQVTQACGAGGGCTACHRHLKRLLAEAQCERVATTVSGLEPVFGFA
jgi:bacterioferritin-associated ferredoxin